MSPIENRDHSKLENMLVIILMLVLIGIALKMLVNFTNNAERLEVQAVLDSIQTSLLTEVSEHLMDDKLAELQVFDGSNPMALLKQMPGNYAGELGDNDKPAEKGQWYFNYDQRVLVYLIKHESGTLDLESNSSQRVNGMQGTLKFKLKFNYADNNENQRFELDIDTPKGLELSSVNE